MGEDLGRLYTELANGASRIQVKWKLYKQLYLGSVERIELINKAADWFFRVVQGALVGDVLLHIARLTDSERIRGRQNLTIRQLPAVVPDSVKADVAAPQTAVIAASKPIREWRNRRGAHTDLATAIYDEPLPDITIDQVETVLASLRALLNWIEQHYWNAPTKYEEIGTPPGDADACLLLAQGHPRRGGPAPPTTRGKTAARGSRG
jgi:AbiU2